MSNIKLFGFDKASYFDVKCGFKFRDKYRKLVSITS